MKKQVCLLLVLACLMLCFVACGKKTVDPSSTDTNAIDTNSAKETAGQTETEEAKNYDDLEQVDFGEKDFHIMTRDSGGTVLWKPIDWTSTGEDDADIPQAVYSRNAKVEEDYNCRILQTEVVSKDLVATATAAYMSQSEDYDIIVMPVVQQMSSMAVNGYYKDLTTLNGLSVTDPWWDSKTNDALALFGHYYTLCGDINIVDNLATWCVMFNKYIVKDQSIESPYTRVDDGTWTLEAMYADAKEVSTEHDEYGSGMYGIGTEFDAMNAYLASAGLVTVKVEDGTLVNNTKSSSFESAFHKIYDYMKDDSVQLRGDNTTDGSKGYNAVNWGALYKAFVGDQVLYMNGTLSNLISAQFAEMTSPFGVLPMPKFSTEQTDYVSTFQVGNATTASILTNLAGAEDAALLLSAMGAMSVTTLTPAFYQQTLYGRKVPDAESVPMMDLILNSRTVDIGIALSQQARSILNESIKNFQSYSFVNVRTTYASALEEGLTKIADSVKNNFRNTEDSANET